MNTRVQDLAIVSHHLEQLGEHFDSVQLFCSRHEHGELGGTIKIDNGTGNFLSRLGQVSQWLVMQDEYARMNARQ